MRALCAPTAAGSMSLQFSGFTPTLELDLLGGSAILPAGNLLIVDAVPEYPKMRHNSSEEDAAVASIQLKLISCLSSQVLSNLKAQSIEGQYEATIPTVADRIAQTVVKMYLEPEVEPIFHSNSYGYRPKRSALDAVEACRKRCWKFDWVIDLDIRAFFDSIDHDLMLKAVSRHTGERWILLYIER